MEKELIAHEKEETWKEEALPGKIAIETKWIFCTKDENCDEKFSNTGGEPV